MDLRAVQQNMENSIAEALDSTESMHRMAAASLFDKASEATSLNGIIGNVRPLYENGATQLFELGRDLNRQAGNAARTLLEKIGQ
ncbi:MAG: hypothetical protein JSR44_08340 [Spirochaetes bacterium]|nr:hypothetical protein [Spirochaetota bacterium]